MWGYWERCKNMQIHLYVSLFHSGHQKEWEKKTAGHLQLFCSKYNCWKTLITKDDYHLPFASLAIDGNITSVIFGILNRFRNCTAQPNLSDTWIFKWMSIFSSSFVVYTLWTDWDVLRPSPHGGKEEELVNHRERATNTRMTSLYVRWLTREILDELEDWRALLRDSEESNKMHALSI